VENEAAMAKILGSAKVIAGTVTSAVTRNALGDIVVERERGVGLSANHPLSPHLVQALQIAGFIVKEYQNAAGMKWSKLLTNLLTNASSAILGLTPAEILSNPRLFRLEIAQLREALAVMQTLQIPVVNLPGAPVVALTLAARLLPLRIARLVLHKSLGSGRGGKMPSLYIDLHSGRGKSEVNFLNGAVVRFGEQAGISTPVNQLLASTLQSLTEGKVPTEQYHYQPNKLLAHLSSINLS
jgi:2-dehydropantoate 2-reductase